METTVTTAQVTDVRGKVLKYLKIGRTPHEIIINVGEKTYNAVKAIEAVQELPLENNNKIKDNKKNNLKTE